MRLPFKISGIIVGKEKVSLNIQIDSSLVCTGEVLVKEKIGGILKTYLEKSSHDAQKLIDITAVHDKSFFTWKSFDKLTDPKANLAVPAEDAPYPTYIEGDKLA
jgi:hypothetical protein